MSIFFISTRPCNTWKITPSSPSLPVAEYRFFNFKNQNFSSFTTGVNLEDKVNEKAVITALLDDAQSWPDGGQPTGPASFPPLYEEGRVATWSHFSWYLEFNRQCVTFPHRAVRILVINGLNSDFDDGWTSTNAVVLVRCRYSVKPMS